MANESDAELLELARTAMANRLRSDGVEFYSTGEDRFSGMKLIDLRKLIVDLERSTGTPARLIKQVCT